MEPDLVSASEHPPTGKFGFPLFHAESREAWRAWLERHHSGERGVWLGSWRTGTGRPRCPYPDAVDGVLHRGAAGNGGEFGHITVVRGGRACLCGRSGCLEAYASGTSIGVRADERLAAGEESTLVAPVTAQQVAAAAEAGDPVAVAVWDETVDLLGQALTDLVNILEPEVVVLGGGVTRSGAQLLDPVRRIVHAGAMGPAGSAVRVELAGLGDAVCVVGAGELALDLSR